MDDQNVTVLASIIIVNYNGEPFIKRLFESLSQQSLDASKFEVIFVDNNSTDESLKLLNEIIKNSPPPFKIKIVKNSRNFGFCKGNNIGLIYAKGRYIVLLNNDTFVDSLWLESLVNAMENDTSIGICASKEVLYQNGTPLVNLGNHFGILRMHAQENNIARANSLLEGFFYAGGSSIIIRRGLISVLGNIFDEKALLGDLDLSWSARLLGFRIVTNPRSVYHHFYSHATKLVYKRIIDREYLSVHDTLMAIIKNYSLKMLIKRLPVYLQCSMLFSLFKSMMFREPVILGWFKGLIWNICNLRYIWKKHLKIQNVRKVDDENIEKYMLPYPAEVYSFKLRSHKKAMRA